MPDFDLNPGEAGTRDIDRNIEGLFGLEPNGQDAS